MPWFNPFSWFKVTAEADPAGDLAAVSDSTVLIEPIDAGGIVAPELVGGTDKKLSPALDAAVSLLLLLDQELGDTKLPEDLREVSTLLHTKIPASIKDDDGPVTQAEFALTIQRGALFLRAMKDWYDSP